MPTDAAKGMEAKEINFCGCPLYTTQLFGKLKWGGKCLNHCHCKIASRHLLLHKGFKNMESNSSERILLKTQNELNKEKAL